MEHFCNTREVTLYTLHHGSVFIYVQELRCERENMVAYDGMSNGLFCTTREHAFIRDLLDAWMLDI